jgi:hypothetical protein
MRKTYLAKWENGTISILTASNNLELFDKLDVEGDPNGLLIYRLPEDFHLGTDIIKKDEKTVYLDIYEGEWRDSLRNG